MNVIPKHYLLNELTYLSASKPKHAGKATPLGSPTRDSNSLDISMVNTNLRKMNYTTATYYLLVKRKELQQL